MFLGRDGFVWWVGVVEDNDDPLLLCRVKVRIFGYHPKYTTQSTTVGDENNLVPTGDLPWATVAVAPNSSTLYSRIGLGEFVLGFFIDGVEAQEPVVFAVIPTALKDGAVTSPFGKHSKSVRSFDSITTTAIDLVTDDEYQKIAKTKLLKSEDGHIIKMTDHKDVNEMGFYHSKGKTKLILQEEDILVQGTKGTFSLIDQLDWISNQTHTTTGGSEGGSRDFTIGTRENPGSGPPVEGGGGGGGGGGCFTGSTLVTMWDESKKRIDEIQVGDLVQSGLMTEPSKVLFIEKLPDNAMWDKLYSPSSKHEPFATPNHLIFVNDEWVAYDTDKYDWMPKTKFAANSVTKPVKGDPVYNLWLSGGDGTYFVNGYKTHSIMYDGGFLRLAWEKGFLTHEQVMGLMYEFTSQGKKLTYGSYLINKMVGLINQKHWIKLISHVMKKEHNYIPRKFIIFLMKVSATIMGTLNNVKEKLYG